MTAGLYRISFAAGDLIFRQGEIDHRAYVIESGAVEISTVQAGKETALAVFPPGEIFGEVALLDQGERSATARAVEDTSLLVITHDQVDGKLARADPVLKVMMSLLIERLRSTHRVISGSDIEDPRSAAVEQAKHASLAGLRQDVIRRLKLEQEMRAAIENNEFRVVYQPIVRLQSGEIAGFEALVRWQHPDRGVVSPGEFIPIAEETGLIVPIGSFVLKTALRQLEAWQASDSRPLSMAVNLSARQFFDIADLDAILEEVEGSRVAAGQIKLEITESVILDDPIRMRDILGRIKQTGALLSLDDFGTGYSSFSHLHQYPFDVLKIDRSFVTPLLNGKRNLDIVRAIIGLAHDLGMEVVAEGIERSEEAGVLRDLGCEYGQGYLFSRPIAADEATALLADKRPLITASL